MILHHRMSCSGPFLSIVCMYDFKCNKGMSILTLGVFYPKLPTLSFVCKMVFHPLNKKMQSNQQHYLTIIYNEFPLYEQKIKLYPSLAKNLLSASNKRGQCPLQWLVQLSCSLGQNHVGRRTKSCL